MFSRFMTITATVVTALSLSVAAASAHVEASADTTSAGGWAFVRFTLPHGCEGAGTTQLEIKLPDDYVFPYVTPFEATGWSVKKTTRKLDKPVKAEHGDVTESADTIVFTRTGDALPDPVGAVMWVSIQWPADAAGKDLHFPVAQTCEGGQSTNWNEIPAKGESEDSLEHPAPMVSITKARAADEHHGAAGAAEHGSGDAMSETHDEHGDNAEDLGARTNIALALGALGLLFGLIALMRGRGSKKD